MNRKFALAWALLLLAASAGAQPRLPGFFSDGMVLQRGAKIPVWGWASPGEAVAVTLNGKRAATTADAQGRWQVALPRQRAGGPHELAVVGEKGSVRLRDVLVGDVYLCSGQSNMELPVSRCMDAVGDKVRNYANASVRYTKLPQQFNYIRPNDDARATPWKAVTPATCGEMGAVAYFLGRCLQEAARVPIGIINSSVGGTRVECWMPRATLAAFPEYADELKSRKYSQENWVDSVRRLEARRGNEWERQMAAADTVAPRWRTPGYDFSRWAEVDVFSDWARGRHGSFWFRQELSLTRGQIAAAGDNAILRLGAMKDADSVFVNGRFVGYTAYEYPPRIYTVPASVLREGRNDIVVRLVAQSGRASFTRGKDYRLELGGDTIAIGREWRMCQGSDMPPKPGSTYFVDTPTGLYNAMIAPLRNFPISGAVWYQGESNTAHPERYAPLLKAMVGAWRRQFGSDFPVVVVQLANYMQRHGQPHESGWCGIRQAQLAASEQLGNAAIATAVDLGEWNDIHPQRKDELGRRAALQLRRLVYGEKSLVAEGPHPVSAAARNGEVVVRFAKATGRIRPSASLAGFAVAGADGRYAWAEARTTGDHEVTLRVPQGMAAASVRYAWDDDPVLSLYNTDGLPSPTFQLPVE